VLRFIARTYAFFYLQTDRWPPFGFEEAPEYPIRALVESPLERYNRWKTGFRFILGIPVFFLLYLFAYAWPFSAVVAWFHIVFQGPYGGRHAQRAQLGPRLPAAGDRLLPAAHRDPAADLAAGARDQRLSGRLLLDPGHHRAEALSHLLDL
jgi:hypothetical protein